MMLYVNGSNIAAAAEAVNPYTFACEDEAISYLGNLPHPENLSASWGKLLSLALNCAFLCEANSNYSIKEIIESTRTWVNTQQSTSKLLVIIQWPKWDNIIMEQYEVHMFHKELQAKNIHHLFFNGYNSLSKATVHEDWAGCFVNPYDDSSTFEAVSKKAGFDTVSPTSTNFGKESHGIWNKFLLNYIISNKIVDF